LKSLKQEGAVTIGQDERSCVVYGMPRAAADLGAVDQELPLTKIAEAICQLADKTHKQKSRV
jgi:two-component system chemotaxis response regulator CheB